MRNVRTIRTSRTPRTARTARDMYCDLNQPIRSQNRTPLTPSAPAYTPRPRVSTQRQFTDTTLFRSVDDKTQTVDYVINSGRKTKAAEVQQWIDEFSPSPIEILRKIAQVSQPHAHLLNLICDELEKFPPEKLRDPINELNDDAFDQIAGIKIRSHDLENEIEDLKLEENELKAKLKESKENLAKIKDEYDRYTRLVQMASFDSYENDEEMKKRQKEVEMLTKKPKNDEDSIKYNALWGENNHLRDETQKLINKIDEQRKLHQEFTHRQALKKAAKNQLPHIQSTIDESFLNLNSVVSNESKDIDDSKK